MIGTSNAAKAVRIGKPRNNICTEKAESKEV
jgi:hypothetical protein